MYIVMIIGEFGRLLTIPYETRLLQVRGMTYFLQICWRIRADLHAAPIPFLAILRQASYAQAFYILWVWTIERQEASKCFRITSAPLIFTWCATVYVADYEKNARLQISIILNVIVIFSSYATGYVIVTGNQRVTNKEN